MSEEKTDKETTEKPDEGQLINTRNLEVLIAQLIPTTRYFDVRFDFMQNQINNIDKDIKEFRGDVDKRFSEVRSDMDKRFDHVDKRFSEVREDMDKRFSEVRSEMNQRFEQVDKRFEQIIASIDRIGDKLDLRDENQRGFTVRLFTIAIGISIFGAGGAFLKAMGVF